MRNDSPVRNSIVLKKEDSFRKLASTFGDQLLLQFVEKSNLILCCDGCTLFEIVYKQNSIFGPADRRQHLAWWLYVSWTSLDEGNHCISVPWMFFGLCIIHMEPILSIVILKCCKIQSWCFDGFTRFQFHGIWKKWFLEFRFSVFMYVYMHVHVTSAWPFEHILVIFSVLEFNYHG
jgi:hypothetical protein